jgi:hypothetical protein
MVLTLVVRGLEGFTGLLQGQVGMEKCAGCVGGFGSSY